MKNPEELKSIIEKQTFSIFTFGENETTTTTELIEQLNLEDNRKKSAFTYSSPKINVVFLKEGLANKESAILLMHEEAHIFLGHLNENKRDTSIYDEEEAHAFVEEIKRQLEIKEKESKLYENSATSVIRNEDTKIIKNHMKSKNIVFVVLVICVLAIFAKYCLEEYNKSSQLIEYLETTPKITTTEIISNTTVETTLTVLETTIMETSNTTEEESTANDSKVYITKTGKKYHREDCYMITNKDVISLSIEEAQKLYEPCAICRPNE